MTAFRTGSVAPLTPADFTVYEVLRSTKGSGLIKSMLSNGQRSETHSRASTGTLRPDPERNHNSGMGRRNFTHVESHIRRGEENNLSLGLNDLINSFS